MALSEQRAKALTALCKQFRTDVLTALYQVQSGHPGGSLSCTEILTALYFEVMHYGPENADSEDRDKLILSKGHAAPMLYRVLAEKGFFPVSQLQTLRQIDSLLQGHPCRSKTPGVELSTGPLGLGLGAGLGMALAKRLKRRDGYVYVLLGDGECQEGAVWEAAMAAHKFRASKLIAILDQNGVQLDGTTEEIMPMLDIGQKFEAFGWRVLRCDGHDIAQICEAIQVAKEDHGKATLIVCSTVKGKGIPFMEGKSIWHGKPLDEAEYTEAMRALGGIAPCL